MNATPSDESSDQRFAKPPKHFISTLLLGITLLALLLSFSPSTAQAQTNTSLRVVTYNTHLISPGMRCLPGFTLLDLLAAGVISSTTGGWVVLLAEAATEVFELTECLIKADDLAPDEAEVIATRILAEDYDVIALNEVFDEDAKDTLVDRLAPTYPHYVRKLEDGTNLEDSGLMLFSRFPFGALPDYSMQATDLDATSGDVAFTLFNECASVDCFSAKGAGLVRVEVPNGAGLFRVVNIAFTHMQADYDTIGAYDTERERQFEDIFRLITATLGREPSVDDSIIIMGDLNIEGSHGVWASGTPVGGGSEWQQFANTNQARSLFDAWASTTSVDDIGVTHAADGQRLDYVVTNGMLTFGRGCVQHMTTRYLGESDHIAVTADLNATNHYCDPRRAWDNPPLDTPLNINPAVSPQFDSTQIMHGGSMQWFHLRLDEPSTVSILAAPEFDPNLLQGVEIELYAPNDLTNPIPQYLDETTTITVGRQHFTAKKYVLPQEFYIRVFSPDPAWTGDYTLVIHKHNCQNANDACVLRVNNPHTFDNLFQPGVLLGVDDTAWFQVDVTDRADSGAAQQLRLFADGYIDNLFRVELREKANPAQPINLNNEIVTSLGNLHQIQAEEVGPISIYLVAQRNEISIESRLRVGWESNLTRLHGLNLPIPAGLPMKLICLDETNGFLGSEAGDDEIHLLVNVDGLGFQEILYHDYDCNNEAVSVTLDNPAHVFRFLSTLQVKIVEEDGLINPDDAGPTTTINALPVNIFPPSQDVLPAQDIRVLNTSATWNFDGGSYRFEYSLSHQVRAQ